MLGAGGLLEWPGTHKMCNDKEIKLYLRLALVSDRVRSFSLFRQVCCFLSSV